MDLATYPPTLNEVAHLFGKSSRWIGQLRAKGVMPADGANLAEFVEAWVAYNGEQSAVSSQGLDYERTRLTAEQADAKAMANAVTRRELLPISAFVRALTAGVVEVRARFLAQPSALAQELADITERQAMSDRLTADVYERLEALSEANFDGIMEAAFGGVDEGDGA